jgi:hypothetical protein
LQSALALAVPHEEAAVLLNKKNGYPEDVIETA